MEHKRVDENLDCFSLQRVSGFARNSVRQGLASRCGWESRQPIFGDYYENIVPHIINRVSIA